MVLSAIFLLGLAAFGAEATVQGTYGAVMKELLAWAEYVGILAVGWGTGVVGWLATGHRAGSFLLSKLPRAWALWHRNVLTSPIPIYKYLGGALLLLLIGAVGGRELVGLWTETFDLGLWGGLATGLVWSFKKLSTRSSMVDFLLSNERYVDKSKVSLFENEED